MRAAARWATALAASGAIHGVAAALMLHGFAPEQPDPQDRPATRLQVDTVTPQQQTARPEPLEGSTADEARADGTPLAVGAIPQTDATALDADAPRSPELAVGGTPLASTRPEARAVAAVEGPAAIRGQALHAKRAQEASRDTTQLAVASPPRSDAQQVTPRSQPQPALPPVSEPAHVSTADAPRPPELAVGGNPLASTRPEPQAVAAVESPAAIRAQALPATRVQETSRDTTLLAVASPPGSDAQRIIPRSQRQPALPPVSEPAQAGIADATQATAIAPTGAQSVATSLPSDMVEPAGLPSGRVAAVMPLTDDVPEATPASETAAPVVAKGAAVSPRMPAAIPADQSPLPATNVRAALAWQFTDRLVTDPRALATIEAFISPDALEHAKSNAGQVRDDLSALLTEVDCARLSAVFLPETGKLELRGHIPDPNLRAPLLEALRRQTGEGIPVSDNLQHLPRPQCGALAGIAAAGLPQSTDQFTDTRLIGETAHARSYAYTEGQRLEFDLAAPDYDAFIYVDYFNAAGDVIHLVPNEIIPLRRHDAGSVVGVGQNVPGEPGLQITIGPPYGQEIAVAFAASRPLYDRTRPITEPAAPYLEFLKNRIDAARAADLDFKGEWVYFFLTTSPN